jgi:hypothetical protein
LAGSLYIIKYAPKFVVIFTGTKLNAKTCWTNKIVYDATQTPASFKTLLVQLYNSPNLHLTEKLDVTVRKVARDPPRHRVTLIGAIGDITLFIDFVSQELGVTFKIVDRGFKMEKTKVSGQFKILNTFS